MVSRLDIIAELLLRDPIGIVGFVYRVVGGARDGEETVIERAARAAADDEAARKAKQWKAERLVFVRKQDATVAPAAPPPKARKARNVNPSPIRRKRKK